MKPLKKQDLKNPEKIPKETTEQQKLEGTLKENVEQKKPEGTSNISTMKTQISGMASKYITTFSKFPMVSKIEGITDIKEIINRNINFEVETKKLQKKLTNYLNTMNKMLEAGINAAVLHQHFLGCIDIALQCQDLLCMKIFLSQAHSTFAEIIRYIREYMSFSRDIEKFTNEVNPLLKFVHPSIEFSEQFLKMEEVLLTDIEKSISELEKQLEK
jgi:hypothetical protein